MSWPTDDQLRLLGDEAAAAGDLDMWAITEVARGSRDDAEPGTALAVAREEWTQETALTECERVVADAKAQS